MYVLLSVLVLCVYSLDVKNLAGPPKDFVYHRKCAFISC